MKQILKHRRGNTANWVMEHQSPTSSRRKVKKKKKKRASQRLLICLSHLCLLLLWELMKQQTEGRFPVLVRY